MRKIVINFKDITSENELNNFLDTQLSLTNEFPHYGKNFSAFWDVYAYSDYDDYFEIINIESIESSEFKDRVEVFLKMLEDLQGCRETDGWTIPNPNFSYKVV